MERQLGPEVVSEQTYNLLGESNWAPLVAILEGDGVAWLNFSHDSRRAGSCGSGADRH